MRILYTLFSYALAIRFFAKERTKKAYLFIGLIVSLLVMLTDIMVIISLGFINYIKVGGWQILVSYALLVIYTFITNTKLGLRNMSFERKKKKKIKETISTSKSRGLITVSIGVLILLVGAILLVIELLDIYDVPLVAFIVSLIGFVVMILFGIFMMKKASEKMILLIWTDKLDVYSKKIEGKMSFNYFNVINEISKYYIIEKLGTVYYKKGLKEIHYVWILKTENLNNYDITKLPMEKENKYWYNEVVNDMYKLRSSRFTFEIGNDKIVNVTRR